MGRHLWPALRSAGHDVRCLTRDAARAARRFPDRAWVQGDVLREEQMDQALEGCAAAYYLVHGMGERGQDFRRRELAAAARFGRAAERSGVQRIVYLGGPAPQGPASVHLQTRIDVGETLRASRVPTLELRAAMIIGHGSASWLIVRDLAARLPVMVLPRWLRTRSRPVAIDDVVVALVRAPDVDLPVSRWYEIPGPEVLDGREILDRTAAALGLRPPLKVEVPLLTLELSAQWLRLVTRAQWSVAHAIVLGLQSDLLPTGDPFWPIIEHRRLIDFDEAARRALAEERERVRVRGLGGLVEQLVRRRQAAAR